MSIKLEHSSDRKNDEETRDSSIPRSSPQVKKGKRDSSPELTDGLPKPRHVLARASWTSLRDPIHHRTSKHSVEPHHRAAEERNLEETHD